MSLETTGKLLVGIGLLVTVAGGLLWLLARAGLPLGSLRGDIRIEREGFSLYFPLATTLLISLALTVILNIVLRLLRR